VKKTENVLGSRLQDGQLSRGTVHQRKEEQERKEDKTEAIPSNWITGKTEETEVEPIGKAQASGDGLWGAKKNQKRRLKGKKL